MTPLFGRQSESRAHDVLTPPVHPTEPAPPPLRGDSEFLSTDRYKVIGKLGEGGMGVVYMVYDRKLERPVALKVLRSSLFEDAASVLRFRREAEKLTSLNHPNVVSFHGVEEVNGNQVLVMELLEGSTLDKHLSRPPIATDQALSLVAQIADGLNYLHQSNVVHRDLAPSNIFVLPEGTVKIIDFGIAHLVSDNETEKRPGTAAYLAPEQLRNEPCDIRSDIWSFGVIAYEMLAGRLPWPANVDRPPERRYEPDWSALSHIPAAIRALLRQCLQPDRRRRLAGLLYARKQIEDALAALHVRLTLLAVRAADIPVSSKNIIAQERRWFLLHGTRPPRQILSWPLLGCTG